MTNQVYPRVFIVLINYNTKRDTIECLDSLEKLTYPNYHIVVVDNDSIDNELSKIEARSNVTLIKNPRNLGVGGGNNTGIRYALAHNADYVLTLNSDTTVEPNLIEELLKSFTEKSDIGLVAPWIAYHSHPEKIWFATGRYNPYLRIPTHPYMTYNKNEVPIKSDYADFVSVCASLIKREVFEKAGLWNEDLFIYGDDPELCLRAKRFGYRCYVTAKVLVYHKIQASAGVRGTTRLSPLTAYYCARGFLYCIFLTTPPFSIKRITGTLANCLVLFPYQMLRSHNMRVIIPYLQGLIDAMRGKMGPWKIHMRKDGRTLDGQKIR